MTKDDKPKPTNSDTDEQQLERFKKLAKNEGLDTPEAKRRFEGALFSIAKAKPSGKPKP